MTPAMPPPGGAILSLLLATCLLQFAASSTDLFFLDPSSPQVRDPLPAQLSFPAFVGSLAALLRVPSQVHIDEPTSAEINSVLSPDFLHARPDLVWSLTLAGVSSDDSAAQDLLRISASAGPTSLAGTDAQTLLLSKLALVNSVEGSTPSSRSGALVLNGGATNACGDACLDNALVELAAAIGAEYRPAEKPVHGKLTLQGMEVQLENSATQLWAREVAGLWNQLKMLGPNTHLVDTTLTGIQLVRGDFGMSSDTARFVVKLTALAVQEMSRVVGAEVGSVVTVVTLLGDIDEKGAVEKEGFVKIIQAQRRKMLQVDEVPASEPASTPAKPVDEVTKFNTKAAAFSISIVIFMFMIGGLYVMTNMDFKQDTLLYSRAKAD